MVFSLTIEHGIEIVRILPGMRDLRRILLIKDGQIGPKRIVADVGSARRGLPVRVMSTELPVDSAFDMAIREARVGETPDKYFGPHTVLDYAPPEMYYCSWLPAALRTAAEK